MQTNDLSLATAHGKRLLVVDDSQTILKLFSRALGQAGYDVVTAIDGLSALDMVSRSAPDFVITDWNMPGMNGKELCASIRSLTTGHYVYIILMTANTSEIDLTGALRAGADEFLSKPVKVAELCSRLEAASRLLDVERRLRVQASHDSLTGLLNRQAFTTVLEKEHARCLRHGSELSLMMIDIDHFKDINDTYGHRAGDMVLSRLAESLKLNVRAANYLNRYGGDEFCVLLTDTNIENALHCAERLRTELSRLIVEVDGRTIPFTASFGLAECDLTTFSPSDLVERADQALLHEKRSGRNTVGVWGRPDRQPERVEFGAEVTT